jgi:ribosomal protein S15P/S13E
MQTLVLVETGTMSDHSKIDSLVEETIHSVIIDFDPDVPDSYRRSTETLQNLEHHVETSAADAASKRSLWVRIRTHLALMAYEVEDNARAERLASAVLALASPEDPDFSTAALIRIKSLHSLGSHDEEIAEGLKHAETEVFAGHSLVYLLAYLARCHPKSIDWKDSLIARVKAYVRESPELAQRIERAPISEENPEEYILGVYDIARAINFEMTARVLGEAE